MIVVSKLGEIVALFIPGMPVRTNMRGAWKSSWPVAISDASFSAFNSANAWSFGFGRCEYSEFRAAFMLAQHEVMERLFQQWVEWLVEAES